MSGRQRPKARQFMWPRYTLYLGGMGKTEWHAHHMIQVVFSLDRPFKIRERPEGAFQETRGVVIPSDVAHQVRVWRSKTVILWLDPEGEDGRHFAGEGFIPLEEQLLDEWSAELSELYDDAVGCVAAQALAQRIVADLTPQHRAERPLDERITMVMNHIHTHLLHSEGDALAIGRLGEVAHLSESRLMHLFRQEVGVTVRGYILWMRLHTAVRQLAAGATMTEAAYAAGFADAAHMNRTYRRMFGAIPSDMYRNSRFVQLFSCGMG